MEFLDDLRELLFSPKTVVHDITFIYSDRKLQYMSIQYMKMFSI